MVQAASLFRSATDWTILHELTSQEEAQRELDTTHSGVQLLQLVLLLADERTCAEAVEAGLEELPILIEKNSGAIDRAERILFAHPLRLPLDASVALRRHEAVLLAVPDHLKRLHLMQPIIAAVRGEFDVLLHAQENATRPRALLGAEASVVRDGFWRSSVLQVNNDGGLTALEAAKELLERCYLIAKMDMAPAEAEPRARGARPQETHSSALRSEKAGGQRPRVSGPTGPSEGGDAGRAPFRPSKLPSVVPSWTVGGEEPSRVAAAAFAPDARRSVRPLTSELADPGRASVLGATALEARWPSSSETRLSSPPSRRSSSLPPPRHEYLAGADGNAVRFRPARLAEADLPMGLVCGFRYDGAVFGPLAVLDLSISGFAAAAPEASSLFPGSVLESFELLLGERVIWTGDAVVVHFSGERVGGRFTSGLLDFNSLRLSVNLGGRLAIHSEQREKLPAEWRAAVGDVRQLLEEAQRELSELERSDALDRTNEETTLFEGLRATWGSAYYSAITQLHEMSNSLDTRAAVLGRAYASAILMPILIACPLHRRAYEKPLGYAGDYRTIELCFLRELGGDGLFGRFLHSIGQNYTLARAVVARERVVREAVRDAANSKGDDPVRILAVAAGPAIELRRFLDEIESLRRPVELVLLDQDPAAHEMAHRSLTRILLERQHGTLPVTVQCLHSSVRQLLRPRSPEDQRVVSETLADLDFVYSLGLCDYLPDRVAAALTQLLYTRLRRGGRLLLGNLVETPDTTWILDYVLDWPLVYRTDDTMRNLARGLADTNASIGITRDGTGRCIFLDVKSPSDAE